MLKLHELYCLGLNRRIIAEAAQPAHLRLAPEPSHLSLGVVAMRLLRRLHRQLAVDFTTNKLQRLFVSQRCKGESGVAIFGVQTLRFFDESRLKHPNSASIDAAVKRVAVGIEADAQHAEAGERG